MACLRCVPLVVCGELISGKKKKTSGFSLQQSPTKFEYVAYAPAEGIAANNFKWLLLTIVTNKICVCCLCPRFTAWLGNLSTGNKQKRLLGEMTTALAASGHVPLHR